MPFIQRPLHSPNPPNSLLAASAEAGDEQEDERKAPESPEGPVRTQMVGETPEDDLGYDPNLIPTEPIADDD